MRKPKLELPPRGAPVNLRPAGTHIDQHRKSSRARAKRELRQDLAEIS